MQESQKSGQQLDQYPQESIQYGQVPEQYHQLLNPALTNNRSPPVEASSINEKPGHARGFQSGVIQWEISIHVATQYGTGLLQQTL